MERRSGIRIGVYELNPHSLATSSKRLCAATCACPPNSPSSAKIPTAAEPRGTASFLATISHFIFFPNRGVECGTGPFRAPDRNDQ